MKGAGFIGLGTALAGLCLWGAPAFAVSWTVDPSKSTIGFSGSQIGSPFQGTFKKFKATIDFDPAKPETGHVLVTVDMASAGTGDPQRDESLPQADWFNVAQFPNATFEATHFNAKGGDTYEAVGKLTIRGVSADLMLPFTLTMTGTSAEAKGHVQILRSAFGVGQGSWATPDMVAFEVGVDIDVIATK